MSDYNLWHKGHSRYVHYVCIINDTLQNYIITVERFKFGFQRKLLVEMADIKTHLAILVSENS